MRTAGFLKKTLMGLLHGIDILCPEEQILWNAYYSLFPFDPTIKPLIDIRATLLKEEPERLYPIECRLNQPIEDLDPFGAENKKRMIAMLNAAAMEAGVGKQPARRRRR